ncbi:MAG: transposase [Prevotella sp.]|nr:transposase [Prevotella sp.]
MLPVIAGIAAMICMPLRRPVLSARRLKFRPCILLFIAGNRPDSPAGKNRNGILTFLYHQEVPPDSNGSERAIQNIKVKTKVSGQFRNRDGKGGVALPGFALLLTPLSKTDKGFIRLYPAWQKRESIPYFST